MEITTAQVLPTLPVRLTQTYIHYPTSTDEPCILGIDEAGRGPVLGPMVYAISIVPIPSQQVLVDDISVKDSKIMSAQDRQLAFNQLVTRSAFAYQVIPPQVISASMLKRTGGGSTKISLNALALYSTIDLIQHVLARGIRVHQVFVDTIGIPETHQANLNKHFPNLDFIVAKKADALYPCVSAASIVAKVVRDYTIDHWVLNELGSPCSLEFGSGYPSDPQTKTWLQQSVDPVFGWVDVVRFSWATVNPILAKHVLVDQWPTDRINSDNTLDSHFKVITGGAGSKKRKRKCTKDDDDDSSLKDESGGGGGGVEPIWHWLNSYHNP